MKLREAIEILEAKILFATDELLEAEVKTAASSDLMSAILARVAAPDILLTGLTNAQAIRTASVFGIRAVIVVRGRPVEESLVGLAEEEEIVLASTHLTLFEASGKLYEKGLRSAEGTG